ncbi:MAG: DUF2017 domain-containing protein [Frankia sp.]|nr:DUF2017 domain-containing protein [Frankia sp.]
MLRGVATNLLEVLATLPAEDPAVGRLLPDGYRDDPRAAAELRSLIQDDLVAGKRRAAMTVLGSLPEAGGRVLLDEERAEQWLAMLNDARLTLGTRLAVTQDDDDARWSTADDATQAAYELYRWLGWLQEGLVEALAP